MKERMLTVLVPIKDSDAVVVNELPAINSDNINVIYKLGNTYKRIRENNEGNYEYVDETHEVAIKTPEIIVKEVESEGVDKLNEESRSFVDQIIEEFESGLTEGEYQAIYVDYEVLCDTEEWFTLKLSVAEVMASSNEYFKYYHIDKMTGKLVSLSNLFVDDEYVDVISENIYQQMKESSGDYWVEKADEDVEACYVIDADQNFYFNKDGDIVIVYDKYVVGPGSMGCPEFTVPQEVYEEYLK